VRDTLVATLVSVTFAPITVPPEGSVTVPRTRPPVLCADEEAARTMVRRPNTPSETVDCQNVRKDCLNLMDSPLNREVQNLHRIFVVAVPPQTLL